MMKILLLHRPNVHSLYLMQLPLPNTKRQKQQQYVTKNRFSLFSKDLDPNDGYDSNQSDSMELETDQTEPIPTPVNHHHQY